MGTLYGRTYDLRIGKPGEEGRKWTGQGDVEAGELEGLQVTFEVERKSKRRANKLRLKIYNLNSDSVGFIEQSGNVITLRAGYRGQDAVLFTGNIAKRGVTTTFEGTERITSIEAGGAELELQRTRFAKSYAQGTPYKTVIDGIIDALGIGQGNLGNVQGLDKTFATGFTYAGRARGALTEVVNLLGEGYSWSIQDGQLQILERDETIDEQAVLLTPDSGLVGAPQRQKRGLEAVSLMRPELKPGKLVKVESREFNAFFKVRQVTHVGDFRGNDWHTKISAREIKK